jgi:hypothetical protein
LNVIPAFLVAGTVVLALLYAVGVRLTVATREPSITLQGSDGGSIS